MMQVLFIIMNNLFFRRLFMNFSCGKLYGTCAVSFLQESRRIIQELENSSKQLSKNLKEANEEKAVSIP